MALTHEQIENLKVGQPLLMKTRLGMDDYTVDAKVEVIKIGKIGCLVKVTEIFSVGGDNSLIYDKQFAVTFEELELFTGEGG
ncbi:MAG TPA: hypothetical protein VMR19_04715 [Candidatus Saccharimonadales bacterium]|jgi:hypothetical protein|nr:hypothetical protein [Candidatus Saccharimonadales bacterium]